MDAIPQIEASSETEICVEDVKISKSIGFSKFDYGWKYVKKSSNGKVVYVDWMGKVLPWSENCLFSKATLERKVKSQNTYSQMDTVAMFYFNNRYPEMGDIFYDARSQKVFFDFIHWLNSIFGKNRV